ncbi:MAG: J domain-containing protein [Myxococcales bacterium]|nr:J domain-containing protein [Myxococcales bacterium]
MAAKDYYDVLGVSKTATPEEIKKAFRQLAMKLHPDRNPDDPASEERFKEVNEAYAVLSDPEKRKQYDRFGAQGFHAQYSTEDIFRNVDFSSVLNDLGIGGSADFFSNLFRGGTKGRRQRPGQTPPGFDPFGQSQRRRNEPPDLRGQDISQDLVIAFEESVFGSERLVQMRVGDQELNINVKIPPGVEHGKRLRIAGKGGVGSPPGDLLLRILVSEHPHFTRKGRDLYTTLTVGVGDAVLGTTVEVSTLREKKRVRILPGTQNGSQLRLRDLGIPATKHHDAGHQYVTIQVRIPSPDELTEDELNSLVSMQRRGK